LRAQRDLARHRLTRTPQARPRKTRYDSLTIRYPGLAVRAAANSSHYLHAQWDLARHRLTRTP